MSESIRGGLARDDLDRQSLAVFAFLWAVFAVMEQAKWDKWASSPPDIAFSFTAWWLLFRPKSLLPFALLPAIQLWGISERLPWISNHTTLAAIVDVTILLALARVALNRRRSFDRARVFREFAPVVRLSLLVLFFWAFFHKLNVDWLDPQWSCATSMYLSWTRAVPLLPTADWARQVSVYPPLVIEIAIPLLLISRRTRWLGIVVTAGFHFTLGLSSFYRFGAMVFALLFLFLPGNTVELARRWWVNSSLVHHAITLVEPAKLRVAYLWATRAFLVIAIGVLLSQASWSPRRPWFRLLQPLELPPRSILSHGFQLVWLVVVPALLTIWMLAMRAGKPGWRSGAELLRPYHAIYAIPLALVVLNGALPYLGLKTETSFSMFSNLRTEGGSSNHLIVRRPLRLGTYQDDLVAIVASSDPELRRVAEAGFRLPYFEFRSYLSRKLRAGVPDLEVTYRRGGAERSIRFPLDDSALSRPDPWLPRKLLYFRPVAPEDRGVCQH